MTKDYKKEKEKMLQISPEMEYENQTLKNDFIFGKVMQDPKLCAELLRMLTGNDIEDIESISNQKPVKVTSDGKGVRYDIYVEDSNSNVYDAEMQQYWDEDSRKELPKRSRYYQGLMDLNLLESGGAYEDLKNSFVVFICTFDPFDMNLCCYRFENMCMVEPVLPLGDGRTILFFNTKGEVENVPKEIREFLNYLDTGNVTNEFITRLDDAVKIARQNKEWKVEYMKSLLYEMDITRRATKKGMEEGLERGLAEGRERGLAEGRERGITEGRAEGRAEGRIVNLIEQIAKKVKKNKSIDIIASELETTVEDIKNLYEATLLCGPEYDVDEIYDKVKNM